MEICKHKHLHNRRIVKRGDIFYVDFRKANGSVQKGIRPCVIVQNNVGNTRSRTFIVSPITSKIKRLDIPAHVQLSKGMGGIKQDSMILLEQIMTVDIDDIRELIGHVCPVKMKEVDRALRISLAL